MLTGVILFIFHIRVFRVWIKLGKLSTVILVLELASGCDCPLDPSAPWPVCCEKGVHEVCIFPQHSPCCALHFGRVCISAGASGHQVLPVKTHSREYRHAHRRFLCFISHALALPLSWLNSWKEWQRNGESERKGGFIKRSVKRIKLILFPLCTALNVEMNISLVLIYGADTDTFGSDEHFRLGIKVLCCLQCTYVRLWGCQTVASAMRLEQHTPYEATKRSTLNTLAAIVKAR